MPDVLEVVDGAHLLDAAALDAPPQHIAALRNANEIRLEKAAVKKRLRSGEWNLSQAFLHPPRSAKMGEILMSARGLGPEKVRVILRDLQLAERKPLAELTRRQKQAVYAYLVENYPRAWGHKAGEFPAEEDCRHCGETVREGRKKHKGCRA